ncbi:MAG TPA: hypothetical protein VEW05_29895, partial [Candidatus Polarisedimenticolia bacterium]|nr:hypothetical protein [Candidatus Polarisedimenticolia bacterium]
AVRHRDGPALLLVCRPARSASGLPAALLGVKSARYGSESREQSGASGLASPRRARARTQRLFG